LDRVKEWSWSLIQQVCRNFPPVGCVITFFYANGFEKDFDFYAAYAFTVEPLPKHGLVSYPYEAGKEYPLDKEHLNYQFEYNTRSRSDRLPGICGTRIRAELRSSRWAEPGL